MAARITFDYSGWKARYPEFSAVVEGAAQGYFDEATLYWRNNGTSPNSTEESQRLFLNMLTAHIAALYAQSQGMPNPGGAQDANSLVGRVASATQGSVTVSTELNMVPSSSGMQAWLAQTKYGLSFWAATNAYRRFQFRVPGYSTLGGFIGFPRV
jgi:hypothetical protein